MSGKGARIEWLSIEKKVEAAGADLVEYQRSEAPAAGLEFFVRKYFPRLSASAVGDDLCVLNDCGEELFIRRDQIEAHGGVWYIKGTDRFRTSALRLFLDKGQGVRRNFRTLIETLARFNNATSSRTSNRE